MSAEPSRPTRVVIAEDEAIIRLDLKELLQEEGYDVVGETGRGDEAIELVRDLRPDLVILDIKMPGLDGLSAARHVASERLAAVLMVTAFSQRDLVEQDAWRFLQQQAMANRVKIDEIARRVVDGELTP